MIAHIFFGLVGCRTSLQWYMVRFTETLTWASYFALHALISQAQNHWTLRERLWVRTKKSTLLKSQSYRFIYKTIYKITWGAGTTISTRKRLKRWIISKYFFQCAEKQNYLFSNPTILQNQIGLTGSIPTQCVREVRDAFSIALSSCKIIKVGVYFP